MFNHHTFIKEIDLSMVNKSQEFKRFDQKHIPSTQQKLLFNINIEQL
jgi:hypothetical protein